MNEVNQQSPIGANANHSKLVPAKRQNPGDRVKTNQNKRIAVIQNAYNCSGPSKERSGSDSRSGSVPAYQRRTNPCDKQEQPNPFQSSLNSSTRDAHVNRREAGFKSTQPVRTGKIYAH